MKQSGYYFFIFNNENEVEQNFIHAHFELKKAVYDTSEAVVSCKNETKECALPLNFWSYERTILALPGPIDDSQWNEEYLFHTKCEPRSTLYLICILLVPVCILLFAFSWTLSAYFVENFIYYHSLSECERMSASISVHYFGAYLLP